MRSLIGQDNHLSAREQQVQSKLSSGALSTQQQAVLQNRLSNLQSRQSTVNSALSSDLSSKQLSLQDRLNSGTLTSAQQAGVQNRLTTVENDETALSAGTNPFYP